MSSAREKRLLLGVLALIVPLPLPLNGVVVWPIVLLYLVATSWFLLRAWEDRKRWLPFWAMNLLGLLYLPIFMADLLVLSRQGLVRPVVHLALFTVVVKLFSLQRERDKWQALIGIFFLFLAGMATSVHLSVVLYLLVFLSLSLVLLARFASLHLLTGFGRDRAVSVSVPLRGILAFALLLSVLIAVPLFALLPRVRTPYLATSGFGAGQSFETSGLSDEVTLDSIGLVRTSRKVALRIEFEDPQRYLDSQGSWRFKATTFDHYRGNRWERTSGSDPLYNPQRQNLTFELADEPTTQWAEIWLQPLSTRSLVVPVETARVDIDRQNLLLSRGGALAVPGGPRRNVLSYRVGLTDRALQLAAPPQQDDSSLDLSGVTPEISGLAAEILGEDSLSDRERVQRIEQHLQTQYQYTLDFVGRSAREPIAEFLFRSRSGHCEYFATSMVLLLRSQAIPSRLVTGFLGAETNLLQGYYVVRQENAHAWVEAYLADEGRWETFDPTPSVGRPGLRNTNLWSVALQAYDFIHFRWDRYVLSYDFDDQLSIFGRLRQAWSQLWDGWRSSDETAPAPDSTSGEEAPATPSGDWSRSRVPVILLVAVPLAIAFLYVVLLLWRRWRRPLTAARAYERLRWELERDGLGVSAVDPPLALKQTALSHWPEAAGPAGRVFDLYLQESYAGRPLDGGDRQDLRDSLGDALRRLRKAG